MPRLGGADVIAALRATRHDIRIIASGGGGSLPPVEDKEAARRLRADRLLYKPYGADELKAIVADLLEKSEEKSRLGA